MREKRPNYFELANQCQEMKESISMAHKVLDLVGIKREDEFMKDGISEVTEYPLWQRIEFLAFPEKAAEKDSKDE